MIGGMELTHVRMHSDYSVTAQRAAGMILGMGLTKTTLADLACLDANLPRRFFYPRSERALRLPEVGERTHREQQPSTI